MTPLLRVGLFLLYLPALADYQAGLDAYQQGDYAAAMTEWKAEVTQSGEPENLAIYREALYAIGMLYWQGEGVEQDYSLSAVWLKQAADINHPGAQTKLGYLYSTGEGVPQNYQQAERWLRMAAAQGDPDAQHNLEILSREGLVGEPVTGLQEPPAIQPGVDAGEAWILGQDPEDYTIQVIALRSPEKLHAFIASNPAWSPFAIYHQGRYEQPLWVMVQGNYTDVETAREAVRTFPDGLQKRSELWIRKFGMVQRLIE